MKFFRLFSLVLLFLALIISCGHKKVSLSGDDPVDVDDFIGFFQSVSLPFGFDDSFFQQKDKDSLLISYKVFTQFVPDSILNKVFGKTTKLKIYALGSSKAPDGENYLIVKVVGTDKRAAFILCFDKEEKFIAGMPLLPPDQYSSTTQSVLVDKKYTVFKTMLRRNADGSLSEGKDVYVLNADAKNFMLIMTDPLDDKITEIINPIDTLTRKNKLSADYARGKMNLVSIRDGRKNDRITFFIHFETNNNTCNGELKGEAMLKGPNSAEYRENGESCVLQFLFTSKSVSLKEIEGCGAHRGLRCLFDGNFVRKKEILQKKNIKKPIEKK